VRKSSGAGAVGVERWGNERSDGGWTVGCDRAGVPVPSRPHVVHPDRATRPLTVLLRVHPGAAAGGSVAGTAEVVDTGDVVPVAGVDDLLALLARLAAADAADVPDHPPPTSPT